MNGYKRRTEEKKQKILQAALELFQQHGLNKVTIRDIAAQAGVSHVTIYKHFRDKNDIMRQVIKTRSLLILEELRQVMEANIPLEEKLNKLIFQRARIAAQSKTNQLFKIISSDPELKKFILSVWQKENSKMELKLLEEGIKNGYAHLGVAKETMQLYLGIIRDGLLSDEDRLIKLQSDEKTIHELHHIVLHGLLKDR
jgi:AcrR family transcriptional regulator